MPQNGIYHPGINALSEAFAKNPNMRHINLNDNTFTAVGAKAMAENALPHLKNLQVCVHCALVELSVNCTILYINKAPLATFHLVTRLFSVGESSSLVLSLGINSVNLYGMYVN